MTDLDKWNLISAMTKAMVDNMKSYENTGTKPWDARIAIQDLAYQTGGLLKLDMQLNNERHTGGKTREQLLADTEMELAEVIAVALFAANELGLDVKSGFQRMLDGDGTKIKERAEALKS